MSATPEQHVAKAEKLLAAADDMTAEAQIGFALRASAHMQLARLLQVDPYLADRAAFEPERRMCDGNETDPEQGR